MTMNATNPDPGAGAVAIVGVGAILPGAPDAATFWDNVAGGRYCITDVDPHRWDPALYFDPDPKAPDKTYSKIGGWVRDWTWEPLTWHLPIPPKVADAMDDAQKWAVACARMALLDYGWPQRPIEAERTAVILGNAMAGEKHYLTALRITFPELARELEAAPSFAALDPAVRSAIEHELHDRMNRWLPDVTEDTMPGELGNCMAGRIANLFDLHGPNYVVDAACASAMAAMDASVEGLLEGEFDTVITGGIDRNMGASTYVKFCKIGALSATGTRPFADGADGFVMGEGAALFVLKRLADAERDGDRVYAVIRGIGGASDGKGKGITAPNPVGQRLAVERAWRAAGLSPAACSMVEAHGTSTRVGDVVEVTSLGEAFAGAGLAPGSVALGSVKSNIGHLKGAAGAAGLLKAALALHHRQLPPSLNAERPNPNIDFASTPFRVNTELRDWEARNGEPRVAGVSAFGFGGTNFHVVLEEHVPGRLTSTRRVIAAAADLTSGAAAGPASSATGAAGSPGNEPKAPLRGALVVGADTVAGLSERLRAVLAEAEAGRAPAPTAPDERDLRAPQRVAIDYGDAAELADRLTRAIKALEADQPAAWRALRGRGIFRGQGAPAKVAFLYTGQGSQYVNMLRDLREVEPVVAEVFDEADRIMTPLLDGRTLSSFIFVDDDDPDAVAAAEEALRHTEITQPAVLTVDAALTRLLAAYGIGPDLVMGHSLGEYGALVAAGALEFSAALEAVSARGREMANLQVDDPGTLAAVSAPLEEVERILAGIDGYVVVANVNSTRQLVLGGATAAVTEAVERCREAGFQALPLPVSHAFHTEIVAPASGPLRATLQRLHLRPPSLPIVANVTGRLYPMGPGVEEEMLDLLARQVASPVQFVAGLRTLYDEGARIFVEVGPKRALQGFASDVLGDDEVLTLATNQPRSGGVVSFNQALCGLYAAGLGVGRSGGRPEAPVTAPAPEDRRSLPLATDLPAAAARTPAIGATATGSTTPPSATATSSTTPPSAAAPGTDQTPYLELGHLLAEFLDRARAVYEGSGGSATSGWTAGTGEPVVITGAALGLPGTERVFDDENLARILHGEQFIDVIPSRLRQEIVDRHITRLVKGDDGGASFESIDSPADVIKLAAREGAFDLGAEYGVDADRLAALGRDTQLAIAAGLDALRDAGIPLVQRYKTTTRGTRLPDRWGLPDALRDDTGVIYASAFPGYDAFADDLTRFWQDRVRREELASLESLRQRLVDLDGPDSLAVAEVDRRIHDLHHALETEPYQFDRRFLFRILSMGHSQFAELVGARGPNTQVNAACASTTQAIALAEDWIRAGRCRRVVVVSADDATSDHLLGWIGAGFLASGAAATDEIVEEAALPFDQRRHGMILGMGAAALVVESAAAARERGIQPICEVLGTVTANSAFHGTRLDVDHISAVMESVVRQAEQRGRITRREMAAETVFVSHETYTPARGGSASAEIHALRQVFGPDADRIVIANTKGFTGHPMGVGIEDVVAVKALETGVVPPVPNFREVDPELGPLNLSKGGLYPVRYALRLAAGFGSQISMALLRWTPMPDGRHRNPDELGYAYRIVDPAAWRAWLATVSGSADPRLEVVARRLRVVDEGVAASPAAPTAAAAVDSAPTAVAAVTAATAATPTAESEPAPTAAPAPPVPATEPTEPAEAAAPAGAGEDDIEQRVLTIVAEQTGYPTDLLDLDLDLEADLGIDTVKQAEVFATIRAAYDIPRDDTLRLRDYPTLRHVIGFVRDRAPATTGQPTPAPTDTATPTEPAEPAEAAAPAGAGAGFPRRVPVPTVRPPLAWCAPTGVSLGEGSRVVLAPDDGGVGAALAARLTKLGVEVLTVEGAPAVDELEATLAEWTAAGPVQGVYWLPALDDEGPHAALDPDAWVSGLHRRVKLLAATMRALADHVGPAGTFLVSATRLGGRHGYDDAGAVAPMGGAVCGFTKALARERPDALVKVVDHGPSRKTAAIADLLLDETLRDPGVVEVGYADDLRWSVGLVEADTDSDPSRQLRPDDVYVVTGAAGSIVSAITADLAAASGATFHLLDLVPEPDPTDADLVAFGSDRDGLKRTLAERITARGERATPVLVERELARIERTRAALDAIEAVRAAGGTAHWHQVDLTDAAAVSAVVEAIRAGTDRIDVLLHCAGLEISHTLPDKPQREFDLVFDVKADGWFNLLHALGDTGIGTAVVFSSIAGRFGNAGQTDYSAANDLLCKSVSSFRSTRPDTRGIAIDWTAWADIGMASRGSIPKVMALAGIDMLPPAVGVPAVRRELTTPGPGGEVVVAGALGVLVAERAPAGGLGDSVPGPGGPMAGRVEAADLHGGIEVVTTLDPTTQGFLRDHRIDGTPVLPGVMGVEAFAEAAAVLVPDWHVAAVEDVEFLAPFKFYRDEPREVTVRALLHDGGDGSLVAECRLLGTRTMPDGTEQTTVHFTGRVRLTRDAPEAPSVPPIDGTAAGAVEADAIYRVYFHGPAYRVLAAAWRPDGGDGADRTVGLLATELPPHHEPAGAPLRTAPRLLELCFQTAGVRELGTTGRMALPTHLDRVVFHPGADDPGRLVAVVTPADAGVDAIVVDEAGRVRLQLEGYRTVELPVAPDGAALAPMQAAMR